MSHWNEHDLGGKIEQILADVPLNNPDGHPFGRPYLSAYQLAIEIERRFPETLEALNLPVGGAGVGQRDSLARYVANQLSRQIRDDGASHAVEGAFLSNVDVVDFRFRRDNGEEFASSLTGTSFDLSMYRLRV